MANTKITTAVIKDDAITTAKIADDAVTGALIADDVALAGNPTTTTQSAGNNTTRIATTAFVTTAINNLIDSAPSALDTLNELAAAMGDDANFSTTVTNSIATKLPLAGGTMTGNLEIDVGSGTNAGITLRMGTGSSGANDSFIGFENSAGTEVIRTRYDNPTTSYVISSDTSGDIVTVQRGGNVGIGSSSPTTLTEIRGTVPTLTLSDSQSKTWASGDDIARISFFSRDPSGIGAHETGFILNENVNNSASLSGELVFGSAPNNTAATERMRIDKDGNVGIGTGSPSFTAVSGSSSQKGLHIQNSGNDTSAHLKLTAHNNTGTPGQATNFEIIHRGDALQTAFQHGGSDVLTFDSSGNAGLKETSPDAHLHVTSPTATAGSGDMTTGSNLNLILENSGSNGFPRVAMRAQSSTVAGVHNFETGKDAYWGEASDTGIYYFRGRDLEVQHGNLVIGTSGKGIDFSATGNTTSGSTSSSVLDEYEEGSWTVTDESGAGLSFTVSHNRYTKIGRVVHAHVHLTFPTTSNGSLAKIGLPFACSGDSDASSTGGAVTEQNINSSESYTASVNYSNSLIIRRRGFAGLSNSELSGKNIRFLVTYFSP